jgi:hypothetical protein
MEFRANDSLAAPLEKHSSAESEAQIIEVEIEVTNRDVENLRMMKESAESVAEITEREWIGINLRSVLEWDISSFTAGHRFAFRIVDNSREKPSEVPARVFLEYLSLFDPFNQLRNLLGLEPLSMPMISMPTNRSSSGFQNSLSLASHTDSDVKRGVDATNSRAPASITSLAIGRIAKRYRLLLEKDNGKARDEFRSDPQLKSLSEVLGRLGYSWELTCTNIMNNQYDVELTKQDSSFLVGAASSGEKELLTYLFAIYALNVRDALILIDEPELHLHPKWQRVLLDLFVDLSEQTNNQFVLATHSPIFVSPLSIPYISRVYSSNQRSKILRLGQNLLPETKHLFSIVNSQNNERLFFADAIILVEGISDRLFFEAVFQKLKVEQRSGLTVEIIEVGGKGFFEAYKKLLRACKVPHFLIADLDYLNEIGTSDIKSFFTTNEGGIVRDVVRNEKSFDGANLFAEIERAIQSADTSSLEGLWSYIKARKRRLRADLTSSEEKTLQTFIEGKSLDGVWVLSSGALEAYLPTGHSGKDLDRLIRLLETDYWGQLPRNGRRELIGLSNVLIRFFSSEDPDAILSKDS